MNDSGYSRDDLEDCFLLAQERAEGEEPALVMINSVVQEADGYDVDVYFLTFGMAYEEVIETLAEVVSHMVRSVRDSSDSDIQKVYDDLIIAITERAQQAPKYN